MLEHFGDRVSPPPVFARMLEDGRAGRKAGKGFHLYGKAAGAKGKKGGMRPGKRPVDPAVYELLDWQPGRVSELEIAERCWLQMLNETARCTEDGVIGNPVDVDVGVIFGLGFPPFRGGVLHEADRVGLAWVVERLDGYAERYGERLAPAQLLRDMARDGRRFHSSS
jgi:3-hydroxyacyl-CoA dehydrogenase/enoyl-CoA hydratase/3-hydroxybutyryl-CoA epimerase